MAVSTGDLLRYGLWAGLLMTANANRRHFGLPTTWVFHAGGNTLALLLPEIYGAIAHALRLDERAARAGGDGWEVAHRLMRELVRDNPRYVAYVAPLTLAYLVSHPKFNIYKGELARWRIAGFGLDSIPHAITAAMLTRLTFDLLDSLARQAPPGSALAERAGRAQAQGELVAGGLLALATAVYETAEWAIHHVELHATGGDVSRINMEWSAADTVTDVCSNTAGWLLAVALHRRQSSMRAEGSASLIPAPSPTTA